MCRNYVDELYLIRSVNEKKFWMKKKWVIGIEDMDEDFILIYYKDEYIKGLMDEINRIEGSEDKDEIDCYRSNELELMVYEYEG